MAGGEEIMNSYESLKNEFEHELMKSRFVGLQHRIERVEQNLDFHRQYEAMGIKL